MNINKNILGFLLAFVLLFAGCAGYPPYLEGKVITTSEWVLPDYKGDVGSVPVENLPQELQDAWAGKTVVVVPKEAVKAEAPQIPLKPNDNWLGFIEGIATIGLDVLIGFFPGLAAYAGIIALLFRRPRQHFADAVKAIVPSDGTVDIKGAVVSVAKGLGMLHTGKTVQEPLEKPVASGDEAPEVSTRIDETNPA